MLLSLCLEYNNCVDNNCTNGATCIDGNDEYSCKCKPGYTGRFCEIGK